MKHVKLFEGFSTRTGQMFDSVFSELGYSGFHEFIEDNPGAVEALLNWIVSIDQFKDDLKGSNIKGLEGYIEIDDEE